MYANRQIKKGLKKLIGNTWPEPDFDSDLQPHFIFILTPQNSGSTAIAELLNSSYKSALLHPKGEGQWLIPTLCDNDRWDEAKYVNYFSLKSVWLNKYQEINCLIKNIDYVIEKSPPNMLRFQKIKACFRNSSTFVNNRNPYANVSSMLFRYHSDEVNRSELRIARVKELTQGYIRRSKVLQELIEEFHLPNLSYEDFCADPTRIKDLGLPDDLVKSIDFNASVNVKDYKAQGIKDCNPQQIAKLTQDDLDAMNSVLHQHQEVLHFFGYQIQESLDTGFRG